MSVKLGEIAPDFEAVTTQGSIRFHEYLGIQWGILFSHPANFTPVCTTELGAVAKLQQQFQRRNTKVIALSVDHLLAHHRWVEDIEETQDVQLNFPIIADEDRKIAELYEMIQPGISEKTTVRSVFIIGPDKKVKLTLTYPPSTGRNFEEILRVLDSLQLTAYQYVATPADWRQGDDVVVLPNISDENAAKLFPKGIKRVKPYLRYTPQPNL